MILKLSFVGEIISKLSNKLHDVLLLYYIVEIRFFRNLNITDIKSNLYQQMNFKEKIMMKRDKSAN